MTLIDTFAEKVEAFMDALKIAFLTTKRAAEATKAASPLEVQTEPPRSTTEQPKAKRAPDRINHLARYSRKSRTRKKNIHRLTKERGYNYSDKVEFPFFGLFGSLEV